MSDMNTVTKSALPYLAVPYPDLERMADQDMGETLLALSQAPVTPDTRFYETPMMYESASNPCHVLLWLIPDQDAPTEPVTIHINKVPVCVMKTGECASIFTPSWTFTLGLEVGGRLTPLPEPSTYISDNLSASMPESGVDAAMVRALEAARPFQAAITPAALTAPAPAAISAGGTA